MKRVIICEKPSLAKAVISWMPEKFEPKKFKGSSYANYFESPNYYVTYAMGHLFEAYDIEDYTKSEEDWSMDILPFCPPGNQFYFKLRTKRNEKTGQRETDPAIKLQFETISYLINDGGTTGIIHCGDAGREGEIIIRQIVKNANKYNKPMVRLWLKAMSQEAFNETFCDMKLDSEYDYLANEGMARLKMDYLYGVNLTRYLSLKTKAPKGRPFRAGRVICAMVHEIYEREKAIESFVPEIYYALVSKEVTKDTQIVLKAEETFSDKEYVDAAEQCGRYNQNKAFVTNIIKERKKVSSGKLFSLTQLQNKLSSQHKMSLDTSMALIQKIYEGGYITYPRTNTEYLPEKEQDMVKGLIEIFEKQGFGVTFKGGKKIFDDKKVEDHGAICPTKKIPSGLSDQEQIVYDTIRNRFLAVFCKEDCEVDKSTMEITCGDKIFKIHGSILINEGFLKYEQRNMKDSYLPQLNVGDEVNINFQPVEEKTAPPSRYSVASFNDFLENPYGSEKTDDEERYNALMKGLEIGTVASRTSIIGNMLTNGYVIEKNQLYYLAPAGRYLIEVMNLLGVEMTKEKTIETSITLKKVSSGELSENDAIEITKKELDYMFRNRDMQMGDCISDGIISASGFTGEPVGDCPVCGGQVYETKNGFICESNKKNTDDCCFYLSKEDKYLAKVSGKKLTSSQASSLLKRGYIIVPTKTKKGTAYETMLRIQMKEDGRIGWQMVNEIGNCPVCGGNVKITPFGYQCENNVDKIDRCFFVLFRKDKFIQAYTKKEFSLRNAITLLNKGNIVYTLEKKDKSGKYKVMFKINIDRIAKKIQWTKDYVK